MNCMLLIYGDESGWNALPPDRIQAIMADYEAYAGTLVQAGVMRGGSELAPVHTATTVRRRDGRLDCTDGPFAETKEQLGGYFLIEVPTLDDAIAWAGKCPAVSHGFAVEIRPLMGAETHCDGEDARTAAA